MEKQRIRDEILLKRKNIEDKESKDKLIFEHFKDLYLYTKASTIHCYVSKDEEVNTFKIIDFLKDDFQIIVPYVEGEEMKASKFSSFNDLTIGTFDCLEPKNPIEFESSPDAIILPGLAFDEKGNRIGHGKGFYDKYLSKHNVMLKIALAYDFQILNNISASEHDISVDVIITDRRIIYCN